MRLSVALHLISFSDKNENSLPGSIISSCVKMALREKKIQSLNIFIENGIIISENIEIEDGIDFVSTTYGNFHIIKEILKPYQWNEKKIQNEHLPGNLRASLDKYFKENEGIKQGNLEFLISLNNRELFHALSLDKDDLENGSKLLGIAFKKKMLNTLLVLLQNTYIPMDNRYYDDMLKNPFTNEIDILIIKKRFNLINFEDLDASDGNSLLHKIILLKRSDLIEWILKKDCSLVKVVNRDKETAFHLALKEKDTEMFQLLWDHSEQHLKEVKDKKDVQSDTMLSLAVKYKFTDLAVKLVKFGCALQNVDHDGSNVLHLCSKENNTSLADTTLSLEKNQEIMNEFDKNGDTPLHVALSLNHQEMVDFLIEQKDINHKLKNKEENTVLHMASKEGNIQLCEKILQIFCDSQHCLTNESNCTNLLPIQMCQGPPLCDIVETFLNHNQECGKSQLITLFKMLDREEVEKEFKSSALFNSIRNCWMVEDESIHWFATHYEKKILLSHLLSGMNVSLYIL